MARADVVAGHGPAAWLAEGRQMARAFAAPLEENPTLLDAPELQARLPLLVPPAGRGGAWAAAVAEALGREASDPRLGALALQTAYAWLVRLATARILAACGLMPPTPPARARDAWLASLAAGGEGLPAAERLCLAPDGLAWPLLGGKQPAAALRAAAAVVARWEPLRESGTDVFLALYQALVPPALRQALGEFYTPRWLVEAVLEETPRPAGWRGLDPCCGSGAFLLGMAAEVLRETAEAPPEARLAAVLGRLRGIDVNPSAVAAARAAVLLAVAPLIQAVGRLPAEVPVTWLDGPADPGPVGAVFERVVGNPPWVAWRHLPDAYRKAIAGKRGELDLAGADRWVGGTDLNVCAVIAQDALQRWVAPGGVLAFLMPRQLLQLQAAEGWRRWRLPGGEVVGLEAVADWTGTRPFEAAVAPATFILRRGRPGPAVVPCVRWDTAPGKGSPAAEAAWASVRPALRATTAVAVQVGGAGGAYWVGEPEHLAEQGLCFGPSAYVGRRATETSPHDVFWVRPSGPLGPDGCLPVTHGGTPRARTPVRPGEARLEPHCLFPMLRGRAIGPFRASPDPALLVFPHHEASGEGALAPEALPAATRAFLAAHRDVLEARASHRAFGRGRAFYALWRVGPYTFAPWKVVWPELGHLRAAVVSTAKTPWGEDKLVIPEGKVNLVGCQSAREAHYLCALLNAPRVARAYDGVTSALGRPSRLPVALQRFRPEAWTHRALAAVSGAAHAGRVSPDDCGVLLDWLASRALRPERSPAIRPSE